MTTSPPAATAPPDRPTPDRRIFVKVTIGLAILLFLVAASLLYIHWIAMKEPNCVIIVETSPALQGAEISVDNVTFIKPLTTIVGDNKRYSIAFYVDPGDYELKVTYGGEVQHRANLTLSRANMGLRIDLSKLKPTTTPASTEGAI